MSQNDLIARLSVKSHEHIFLHELENDFELSPKKAREILESAKTIFNLEGASHPGNIRPSQIREIVLAQDASPGKPPISA